MYEEYLDLCIRKTSTNAQKFFLDKFPHVSKEGRYEPIPNEEWTSGFWTGILWLSYSFTSQDLYRQIAEGLLPSFYRRMEQGINIETHDLGFLYMLSCVPHYEFFQNPDSCKFALIAADKLSKRFNKNPGYIQAFGEVPSTDNLQSTIIDSLMNLPLLYWASIKTGNKNYAEKAETHALTIARFFIREDGSTYQVCYFDNSSGILVRKGTLQGYSDSSCWSRGQAWAIYGFTLSYKYTKNRVFLDLAIKTADYFISRLPQNKICYWDLIFQDGVQPRDSSAAAIASSGLYELSTIIPDTQKATFYYGVANDILKNLCLCCSTQVNDDNDGLLLHGTYHFPKGWGIDESCIWGDYFYFESLLRSLGFTRFLWYYE